MSNDPHEKHRLFEYAEPVFPQRVKGRFRSLKWWLMGLMLLVYYVTPWIRWDRGPSLPDQAVLVDLANARFYFFWIEIWPHEFYFVAGLLIMAGLGLFLFTSALGRVWCGYACPQTVWTDLFILVERWIEGDRNARIRLLRAPWSFAKARKRITKWVIWFLIGVVTGGAWVFYFADAPTLAKNLVTGQAAFVAYATIAIMAVITFVFGGFMREQICTYMCPWPRIQAAMMDEHSLTVSYREWRGEPRGKKGKAEGDCIDCMACVNVCPQGIDIRDGQQVECITCALCIDACDAMMEKIGKPRGLIDYVALVDAEAEAEGGKHMPVWKHVLRLRNLIYVALWSLVGVAMLVMLFVRSDFGASVRPERNPRFVTLSSGDIRNAYDMRLSNQTGFDRQFHISIKSDDPLRLELQGKSVLDVTVPANKTIHQRVYLFAKPDYSAAHQDTSPVRFWIEDLKSGEKNNVDTIFAGDKK